MTTTPHRGHSGTATLEVGEADTAIALRSGDVPVLASPRVVALCEEAAVAAVEGQLDESKTSVGLGIDLKHFAPTPIGGKVRAEAQIDNVEGRKLTYACRVVDVDTSNEIARGRHVRVVVERDKFLEKAHGDRAPDVSGSGNTSE